jgi:hypothetical protein
MRGVLAAVALLAGLVLSDGAPRAYAQPGFDYSRFPPIRHAVPFYRQDTMVWCWVATAKMVAAYYNRQTPSQCEMLQMSYGVPCCQAPQMCERGGYINEIQAMIQRFGGRASQLSPPGDGFALYAALRRGPIVMHTRQGAGHFVVATGMRVVPTQFGPLGVVAINDPFFGQYEVDFPQLMQAWTGALLIN